MWRGSLPVADAHAILFNSDNEASDIGEDNVESDEVHWSEEEMEIVASLEADAALGPLPSTSSSSPPSSRSPTPSRRASQQPPTPPTPTTPTTLVTRLFYTRKRATSALQQFRRGDDGGGSSSDEDDVLPLSAMLPPVAPPPPTLQQPVATPPPTLQQPVATPPLFATPPRATPVPVTTPVRRRGRPRKVTTPAPVTPPVSTPPRPVSTAATPEPRPASPGSSDTTVDLSPVELRSRKRRRGTLQPAVGTDLVVYPQLTVKAKENNVWHCNPNPNLPSLYTQNRIEAGGPTIGTNAATTPGQRFSLFLNDITLALICVHTNAKIADLRSKFKDQDTLTTNDIGIMELKGLLGVLVMSGIQRDNHVPTPQMWSPLSGCPLYRSTMTERRFTFLMRAIRFDDSTTREERISTDRLAPIRDVWDSVVQGCRDNYKPGPHITVDEQLLGFRGHCPFRMYIPNKPAKHGMKIVMACDADSHYMINAFPYLGKGTVPLRKGLTLGEYFTVALTRPFARLGRTVTTDNWFSSLPLSLSLRELGMEFVGTIRAKPYLPKELVEVTGQVEVGETVALFNHEKKVTLICHRASKTKTVQLLSTLHHNPTVIEKKKTDVQMFYNATKGGVDTFDQLCGSSSCNRKTRRWPLCYFYGIINLSLTNAYILDTHQAGREGLSRREFSLKLAEELCRPWAMHRLHHCPTLSRVLRVIIGSTFGESSEFRPPDDGQQSQNRRKRCYLCPRSSNSRTRVLCGSCQRPVCARHKTDLCSSCYV